MCLILGIMNLAVSLSSQYIEKILNKVSHMNKNDLFLSTLQKTSFRIMSPILTRIWMKLNNFTCWSYNVYVSTHIFWALTINRRWNLLSAITLSFHTQKSRFWIKVAHYMKYLEVCAPKIDDSSWIPVYHEFSDLPYLKMADTAWQFVTLINCC